MTVLFRGGGLWTMFRYRIVSAMRLSPSCQVRSRGETGVSPKRLIPGVYALDKRFAEFGGPPLARSRAAGVTNESRLPEIRRTPIPGERFPVSRLPVPGRFVPAYFRG